MKDLKYPDPIHGHEGAFWRIAFVPIVLAFGLMLFVFWMYDVQVTPETAIYFAIAGPIGALALSIVINLAQRFTLKAIAIIIVFFIYVTMVDIL